MWNVCQKQSKQLDGRRGGGDSGTLGADHIAVECVARADRPALVGLSHKLVTAAIFLCFSWPQRTSVNDLDTPWPSQFVAYNQKHL